MTDTQMFLPPYKSLSDINNKQGAKTVSHLVFFTWLSVPQFRTHLYMFRVCGDGPHRLTLPPGDYLATLQEEEVFRKWTRQGREGIEEKGGGKGASEGD